MRLFKSHPLLKLVNSYVIDSPTPSNISYFWNFGSLLGFCLVIQIVTGVTLAMHYNPSVLDAFNSVEHIMRDVNNGWLIRYLHSNTASAFFFLVYLHIGRGLYYGSYKAPRTLVWTIGTVIFILMMATAFLGYNNSPIWFKLNLLIFLFAVLFKISFIIFYLDDFKLFSSYSIKYFQIFSSIGILFTAIVIMYNIVDYTDIICYANDKNTVDLHGHVSIGTEGAKAIGQCLNTIGINIGLGATMAGVAFAVAKAIAKYMPPVQKAGIMIIVAGSLTAGFAHSIVSTISRNNIHTSSVSNSGINSVNNLNNVSDHVNNVSSNLNKFMDDPSISPLQTLLFDIEGLNMTCLSLIVILCIQIIFKFYLRDSITLKLSSLLGVKFNNKAEYYLNKIIKLNKKMSHIYIWLILLILVIALSLSVYASNELFNNIDSYIAVHNDIKK